MKVHFLFSRTNKIGSRLIAWAAKFEGTGLKQLPSHVAVLIDETWVFEGTMQHGVRVVPYSKWLEKNELLYFIAFEHKMSSKDLLALAASLWGRPYDWAGVIYFAWRYLGLVLFKKPLPMKNHMQRKNAYFCTEYASLIVGKDLGMKSPALFCKQLKEGSL